MKNKIAASLITFALSVMPLFATQEDKTKMSPSHTKAYDAALALYVQSGEETRFTCSTTVIEHKGTSYKLLTAGHCIEDEGAKYFVTEEIVPNPVLQPVTVVKSQNDDQLDFAILSLDSKKDYPVIEIADTDVPPAIEDDVYTINYSLGLGKQVALGKVSSNPMTDAAGNSECKPCNGRYLVHLMNGPGSSGASIIDEKTNKIVGIVELGFRGSVGTAAETMKAYREFLKTPTKTPSPKA